MQNPFDRFDQAPAPRQQGQVFSSPYRAEEEERKRRDQARQDEEFRFRQSQANRGSARDERNDVRTDTNTSFDNVSSLRKEFNALDAVKSFKLILPQVASAMKIASNPNATGADDLNLIYTFGKVMDPGSVVREAEQAMAQNTGSWAQSLEGAMERIRSGERLPPEVRRNLVESMRRRGVEMSASYQQARDEFIDYAKMNSFRPEEVVGKHAATPFQQAEADFTGKPVYEGNKIAAQPRGTRDRTRGTIAGGGGDQREVAQSSMREEVVPEASQMINTMIRQGKSAAEINAALNPMGIGNVDQAAVTKAQQFLRANPKFEGSLGRAVRAVPLTATEQVVGNAFMHPAGTAAATYLNTAGAGLPTLVGGEDARQAFDMARAANPKSAFAGEFAGSATGTVLAGGALRAASRFAPGLAGRTLANPVTADLAYGATYGANTAGEGNRWAGAGAGTLGAAAGNVLGKYVAAPAFNAASQTRAGQAIGDFFSSMMGRAPFSRVPAKPDVGSQMVADSIPNRQAALAQLEHAQQLGVPMLPADLNQGTQALAGAVTRRSPAAAERATGILNRRSRGQVDRAQEALERDFGPGANIPQRSDDLMTQASQEAGDLYDRAYARSGAGAVEPRIRGLLNRPSMRRAMANASRIAAEEGRDPTALGFDLSPQGDVILTSVPSWQSLDYVKRGMDDVIEGYRDKTTGRLRLDTEGRAVNATLRSFLNVVDRANPEYAAARAAYAGPASAEEAFRRGTKAVGQTPDVVAGVTRNMDDARMEQFRLGYRSAMGENADAVRYSSNPYERVAGSPAQRETTAQLFPENANRFFQQADLERDLAASTNNIIGNSKTAARQGADERFAISPRAAAGIDLATSALTGAPPLTSMLSAAKTYVSDAAKLGIGRRAQQRADEVAPVIFNPDLASAIPQLDEIMRNDRVYDFLSGQARQKSRRVGGLLGSGSIAPGTNLITSYFNQ